MSAYESVGSSLEELYDLNRYQNQTEKYHSFDIQIDFDHPWLISANGTEVLQLRICEQKFTVDYYDQKYTENGCLEYTK